MDETLFKFNTGRVTASLADSERMLADNVEIELCSGETAALIGETGSGKTMTALCIMGLLPENVRSEGRILFLGGKNYFDPSETRKLLGREIVYIPQNGAEYLSPARTIGRQLFDSLKKMGVPGGELKKKACEKLLAAGLDDPGDFLDRYPFQMSGGQNQRVTIALGACSEAELVIADEPTNGLDAKGRDEFLEKLSDIFPDAAKLIITHDMSVARKCGKIVVLRNGEVCESGIAEEVLANPKSDYTKALLDALVERGMKSDGF